jgi:hypothetical protein
MQISTQPVPTTKSGQDEPRFSHAVLGMFVSGSGELLVVGLLNLTALTIKLNKRMRSSWSSSPWSRPAGAHGPGDLCGRLRSTRMPRAP